MFKTIVPSCIYKKMYIIYTLIRNFYINNFFVNILCIIKNDQYTYLLNNHFIYKYILHIIPFTISKYFFVFFNYNLIYKIDNIYCITNNKLQIIPFIKNFIVTNETSSLNLTSKIYLFHSSIPLEFLLYICDIKDYDRIELNYVIKGINIKKEINIKDIDTTKYLIYNLFDNNEKDNNKNDEFKNDKEDNEIYKDIVDTEYEEIKDY